VALASGGFSLPENQGMPMQIVLIGNAPTRLPDRPRTLVVKNGDVWLWPGIRLTQRRGTIVRPIDTDTARFWLTKLHGPEVNGRPITATLARAAALLAGGNEIAAQATLDRAGFERLSPEGAILMEAVGGRLGVVTPGMPVLARNPLWQKKDITLFAPMFDQFADAGAWFEKSSGSGWDPTKHPRLGTSPNPGWFAQTTGDTDPPAPPRIKLPPRPGGGPPSEPPPELPDKPPPTEKLRNKVAKAVARWLPKAGEVIYDAAGKILPRRLRMFMDALHATIWLYEKYPIIQSYLDSPRTLSELQAAASNPKDGYNVHHIVEQTPARQAGFPESKIDGPDNLVLIPTIKHWEITGWFMLPNYNPEFGGLSPREYLTDKDWATRYRVGLEALRKFGVLMP